MTRVTSLSINEELERKLSEKGLKTNAEIIRFVRKTLEDVLERRVDLNKLKEGVSADDVGFALVYGGKVYYRSFKNCPQLLKALKEDGAKEVLSETQWYWEHSDKLEVR